MDQTLSNIKLKFINLFVYLFTRKCKLFSLLFLVPWTPYNFFITENEQILGASKPETDIKRQSLYVVNTILTTAEKFERLVGGIRLQKLYPHQRYKVRIAARNSLGVGRFSSDVMVSKLLNNDKFVMC